MRTDSKYELTDFNLLIILQEFRLPICTMPFFYAPIEPGNCSAKNVRNYRIVRNTCSAQDDNRNAINSISILHFTSNVRSDVLKAVKINLIRNMPPCPLVPTYRRFG